MGEEASGEGPCPLGQWDRSYLQRKFSRCPNRAGGLPRTEESIECPLNIPIARIQNNLDNCSIDGWESFFQRVLGLLSRAQRPGGLRRGSWRFLGGGLLGWRCGARCGIRVLRLIVKIKGSRGCRRLSAGAVGCSGRGLARSRLQTEMSSLFTTAARVRTNNLLLLRHLEMLVQCICQRRDGDTRKYQRKGVACRRKAEVIGEAPTK